MRQLPTRLISVLLAALLLLSTAAATQDTEQDTLNPEDGGMEFAVDNEILFGREQGELCPEAAATRAELAAMLCRLFDTERQELPRVYADCLRGAWYYHPMAAAVHMGFLTPTSDTALSPEAELTRAEAYTALARAFCLTDADTACLLPFSDRESVSGSASAAMAAMVQSGVIRSTEKQLRPQDPISRQELAQSIECLTGGIFRGGEAKSEYQNLLLACDTLPAGTVIHENLIIGCNAPEQICLKNVQVEGKLVILGTTEINGGSADAAEVFADCTLNTQLKTLTVCKDGANVLLNSSAEKTELPARHAKLSGSGNAGRVINYGIGTEVSCDTESYEERIDAGLDGVNIRQTYVPAVTRRNRVAEFTVNFSNIDTEHLYGVRGNCRECILNWYLNGKLIKSVPNFLLKKGATESAQMEIAFGAVPIQNAAALEIVYGEQTAVLPLEVQIDYSGAEIFKEALKIPTVHVPATMRYDCTARDGTELSAGDTVWYMGGSDYIQVPGGRFTFVPAGSFEIIDGIYYDSSLQYSDEVAEAFVNEVHDYSSKTDYLIWCNLYSERVFVFSGTQRNWKLQIHGACASGKNYSPTRPGVYKIYSKEPNWDFDGYIVEYPCAFDADIAFHSVTKYPGGGILDDTLGTPVSHGCVRLPDEVIGYIYENCPIDTTVVVW